MSGYVQWNEVPTGGSGGKTDFLRLKTGNTYKVRPLFLPVHFYKYFNKKDGKLRTAVVSEEVVAVMTEKYSEDTLQKPANRFAMFVIDRADESVKVMEFPISVYRQFRNSFEATGKKPGSGKDGGDWQIKIAGSGFNTSYDTIFVKDTPLTEDEKAKIKDALDGDSEKLQKIYKHCAIEEAETKLFADVEVNVAEVAGSSAPAESSPPPPPPPPVASSVDGGDSTPAASSSNDDFDPDW